MKIVQLNIERNLHLDQVIPFLVRERPDVVCMEEVMGRTAPQLAAQLGMYVSYAPKMILSGYEPDTEGDEFGIALLTREPHVQLGEHYYKRSRDALLVRHKARDGVNDNEDEIAKVLLVAECTSGETRVRIGVTHFTWSQGGEVSRTQRADMSMLLEHLARYPELVLCGDFNMPRGNELYESFRKRYRDNVPPEYTTSLDQHLHRVKGLQRMVDYIWSTPGYDVNNVRMVCGVSDHCALVADVAQRVAS